MEAGSVIGGAFDSLLAKLIVTGATREQALERARRALAEFEVEGMATALPFHRAVVERPGVHRPTPSVRVHTRWIETEFDNTIPPYAGAQADADGDAAERERVVVEVGGKPPGGRAARGPRCRWRRPRPPSAPARRTTKGKAGAAASGDALASPMQGTIVKVAAEEGQQVEAGDLVVVLEAMKMEQPLNAHKAGMISGLSAEVGATVTTGEVICEIKDSPAE